MTPQDIREKSFEKAVFGGYDMGGVDDFMDEVAADIEALNKEIASLKGKMKFLVDKIDEYKGSEDAMRLTLMSAQKLASQIEEDARTRAAKTLADANDTAASTYEKVRTETELEKSRLMEAKSSCARFFEDARAMCNRQLDYLDRLSTAQPTAPAADSSVDDAVRSIAAAADRIPDEPAPKMDLGPAMSEPAPRDRMTAEDMTRLFSNGGQN